MQYLNTCKLQDPYIPNDTRHSKTLGDTEHLSKATVCREIQKDYVALKRFLNTFT